MESQRIRSLTKGYLKGWLKFEYPLHLSEIREHVIVNFVEEEQGDDLLRFRALKDFIQGAGQIASNRFDTDKVQDNIKKAFKSVLHYTLPWLKDQKENKIDKNFIQEMKGRFKKRKELQENK